jgi:hypothetical protein
MHTLNKSPCNNCVCNKVGSYPAVLAVKRVSSASVLVLSELEKVDAPGSGDVQDYEDNGPREGTSMRKRGLLESSPKCPVECLKLERLSGACLLGFWLFARTNSQIRQDIPSETSIRACDYHYTGV